MSGMALGLGFSVSGMPTTSSWPLCMLLACPWACAWAASQLPCARPFRPRACAWAASLLPWACPFRPRACAWAASRLP
eukprot:358346-Chlamydomonas_euryale.AAC.3